MPVQGFFSLHTVIQYSLADTIEPLAIKPIPLAGPVRYFPKEVNI